MAQSKKQDTNTGSGPTVTPILASANAPTVDGLKPSLPSTSIAEGSTRPVSKAEALSLLQTIFSDLRSLGCEVSILAVNNRIYTRIGVPDSILVMSEAGHILLDGVPVSTISEVVK